MVREIMRNPVFLAQKAEPATPADIAIAKDLLDTLVYHKPLQSAKIRLKAQR